MRTRSANATFCAALLSTACGSVSGFKYGPTFADRPATVRLNQSVTFTVQGTGRCGVASISFGDGDIQWLGGLRFDGSDPPIVHTYRSWGGVKTVTLAGHDGFGTCDGLVRSNLTVVDDGGAVPTKVTYVVDRRSGLGMQTCYPLPDLRPLRELTMVRVQQVLTPFGEPESKIDFGCAFAGCIYGPAGHVDDVAGDTYPMPGKDKYSMFARVGAQTIWVGGEATFTVARSASLPAPLEICMNDDAVADNRGQWRFTISVSEPR